MKFRDVIAVLVFNFLHALSKFDFPNRLIAHAARGDELAIVFFIFQIVASCIWGAFSKNRIDLTKEKEVNEKKDS